MIRYKEKAKDCQLIVKVRLPFGQSVSDNDLEFFARKCLRGFLRPKRVRSNNRYFVRDLNSKNKTFINGQAIPAQYECEIFDGNRLTLGNEEFIFNT